MGVVSLDRLRQYRFFYQLLSDHTLCDFIMHYACPIIFTSSLSFQIYLQMKINQCLFD